MTVSSDHDIGSTRGRRCTAPQPMWTCYKLLTIARPPPPFKEHPRHRKPPQRGRQRLCNATIDAWRLHVERTLPGEATCTRLLLRWVRLPPRHSGMQVMASTWMPRRAGCDGSNVPPVTAHPPRRLQDTDS
jgi:hypothetical protein